MIELLIDLDRTSQISIADQIAHSISKAILKNELPSGHKLPAERDLAVSLGISRGTVKRAYAKLVDADAIEIIKGSGSYVLGREKNLEENQKREAIEIISAMLTRLNSMGFSVQEIISLLDLHLSATSEQSKNFTIIVVSNNHEILMALKEELSYLSNTTLFSFTLSFMTLDPIAKNENPFDFLNSYDLIVATTIDYESILSFVPEYKDKIIEATISPKSSTVKELKSFPHSTRFRLIYRTQKFKDMMVETLLKLGFSPENIILTHELDYMPQTHSINNIDVILNFNESPVFINPYFKSLNEDFINNGGHIIHFEYKIDRTALTKIEKEIKKLLTQKG